MARNQRGRAAVVSPQTDSCQLETNPERTREEPRRCSHAKHDPVTKAPSAQAEPPKTLQACISLRPEPKTQPERRRRHKKGQQDLRAVVLQKNPSRRRRQATCRRCRPTFQENVQQSPLARKDSSHGSRPAHHVQGGQERTDQASSFWRSSREKWQAQEIIGSHLKEKDRHQLGRASRMKNLCLLPSRSSAVCRFWSAATLCPIWRKGCWKVCVAPPRYSETVERRVETSQKIKEKKQKTFVARKHSLPPKTLVPSCFIEKFWLRSKQLLQTIDRTKSLAQRRFCHKKSVVLKFDFLNYVCRVLESPGP